MPGEKKSKRSQSAAGRRRSSRGSSASQRKAGAEGSPGSTAGPQDSSAPTTSAPGPATTRREPGPAGGATGAPSTGELKFGPNIITEIAVREVSEIEGVAELTGGWRTKGVQVTEVEGRPGVYVLEVRVAVEYGVNCVALAESIRSRIAEAVERMTGQSVQAINVHVTGIRDKGLREEPHEEGLPLGEEHGIDF